MSMTPEQQTKLWLDIRCASNSTKTFGEELTEFAAAVEANRDARVAQLEEALKGWSGIINHQYTGSRDAMNFLQTADNIGQKALSTSSDTWLADKIKVAEVKVLKEVDGYSTHWVHSTITKMIEERSAK